MKKFEAYAVVGCVLIIVFGAVIHTAGLQIEGMKAGVFEISGVTIPPS